MSNYHLTSFVFQDPNLKKSQDPVSSVVYYPIFYPIYPFNKPV